MTADQARYRAKMRAQDLRAKAALLRAEAARAEAEAAELEHVYGLGNQSEAVRSHAQAILDILKNHENKED